MTTKLDLQAEVGRLERENAGILRDKLHFETECNRFKAMHAHKQEALTACRNDLLREGMERDAAIALLREVEWQYPDAQGVCLFCPATPDKDQDGTPRNFGGHASNCRLLALLVAHK